MVALRILAWRFTAGALLVCHGLLVHAAALDLTVSLEPATRNLSASAIIELPAGRATELHLDRRFDVSNITVGGRRITAEEVAGPMRRWRVEASLHPRRIEIAWKGMLEALNERATHRETLRAAQPVADERGSFLPASGFWHPVLNEGFSSYQVQIDVPDPHRGIAPGNLIVESTAGGRYRATFAFPHQNNGVDLMAGPYRVTSVDLRTGTGKAVTVRTYFHTELADQANAYISATRAFINDYDAQIGPYPYSIFSVVSGPTPTGFGMPALTYLDIQVLRLPFIRDTSLRHEVLHNWWGNGVFVDYQRGNWSEGLTTFMADYAFREKTGEADARAMRIEWLRDLAAVPVAEDRPVAAFSARHHGTSQIIGYHKVAMMFLMLRDEIGTEAFDAALRRFWSEQQFRYASWEDLRRAFETVSKRPLSAVFAQWLNRTGLPDVRIKSVAWMSDAAGLVVTLVQSSPPYRLQVPIDIHTPTTMLRRQVTMEAAEQVFTLTAHERPTGIVLDPDFRVLRRLDPAELPPIFRQVMLDPDTTLIVPTTDARFRAEANNLAAKFLDHPPHPGDPDRLPVKGPVLVMLKGGDGEAWLSAHDFTAPPREMPSSGTARVWTTRNREGVLALVITARDAEALAGLARPLPHYGRQSWLVVDGQKVTHRGVWPARSPSQQVP
ncbi:MAG: M1 family peptidase [Betaproteobacteria bacterium]|nr:M1 family peptidase [Betaproteobacteria bacterium]